MTIEETNHDKTQERTEPFKIKLEIMEINVGNRKEHKKPDNKISNI